MVDPGCSGSGFDDVQDLHEKRLVMVPPLMDAMKTIPQKGAGRGVQSCGACEGRKQGELKLIGGGLQK